MSEKISPSHLERTAYVYVRQSTMHQVREHRESQRRQYALADRARKLGFRDVVVVDDDLGRSGSGSVERRGFALRVVVGGMSGGIRKYERCGREHHERAIDRYCGSLQCGGGLGRSVARGG